MLLIELEDRTIFLKEEEVRSVVLGLNLGGIDSGIYHSVTIETSIGVKLFDITFEDISNAKRAYRRIVKACYCDKGLSSESDGHVKRLNFSSYR